jgi:hypothetical protein
VSASAAQGPSHRVALWETLLDAHLNVIYWSALTRRYTRLDIAFRIVIAFSASGTVAAWNFWSAYPIYWKAFSGIACVASLLQPFLFSTEKLKKMSSLVGTWKELLSKYELLYEQDKDLSEPKSWKQFQTMRERQARIDETRLPYSERLRWSAGKEVRRVRGLDYGRKTPTA